jgi:hypothetical protein
LKVSLDRDQIRSYIIAAASSQKEKMKADLNNQFMFLKFDCATRIRVNYLGLNVRYVSPTTNLPTTRTLAVIDTQSKHSASELKDMIKNVLDDYEIPLNHILCCVTDNASNMIKLVSSMNEVPYQYQCQCCGTVPFCLAYGSGSGFQNFILWFRFWVPTRKILFFLQ